MKITRFAEGSWDVECDLCDWTVRDLESKIDAERTLDRHLVETHSWSRFDGGT